MAEQCEGRIRDEFDRRCLKVGILEHDGKLYCKQHHQRAEEEHAYCPRQAALAAAERAVIDAAKAVEVWADTQAAVELLAAVAALRKLEAEGAK